MGTLIIVLTYIAYVFIVVVYTIKIVAWLKMPPHIRWDLYPVIHEEHYRYGGSYYEQQEWWTKPRPRNTWRSLLYSLKDNFYMGEYYKRNRTLLAVSPAVASGIHLHHHVPYPLFLCGRSHVRRSGDRRRLRLTSRDGSFTPSSCSPEGSLS